MILAVAPVVALLPVTVAVGYFVIVVRDWHIQAQQSGGGCGREGCGCIELFVTIFMLNKVLIQRSYNSSSTRN